MTNFIKKVKTLYEEHRTLVIFGFLIFLSTTIAFGFGVIVGEELVAKTPLIYSTTK